MSGDDFRTRVVHAGLEPDPAYGSVIPAIHQTSTFAQRAVGEVVEDYDYSRARQSDAQRARARPGRPGGRPRVGLRLGHGRHPRARHRRVLAPATTSSSRPTSTAGPTAWSTRCSAAGACATRWSTRPTSTPSPRAVADDTRLIWVETPTNPLLNVVDVAGVVARKRNALVAVDNTFATPANQRPLEDGADAVVHSTTKYLGGHSDVIGGAVIVRDADLHEQVRFVQKSIGAVPGPFDCFLVHRGLRTLAVRMRAHAESARAVSEWLRSADGAYDVRWPGFSGMVSFRHPDAVAIAEATHALHAGRVAGRRRVAHRGAPGHDAPDGRGLRRRRARRPHPAELRHRGARGPRGRPPPAPSPRRCAPIALRAELRHRARPRTCRPGRGVRAVAESAAPLRAEHAVTRARR